MVAQTLCAADDCRESHCAECDAHPGECDHRGARYLHPIVYERAESTDGQLGWRVPDHERARWDAAPLRVEAKPVDAEARDIEAVLDEVESVVDLDAALEAKLRKVHRLEPLRVSRLSRATVEGAVSGRLTNPAGLLWKRLSELERTQTTTQ